jgi:hypothetical protein
MQKPEQNKVDTRQLMAFLDSRSAVSQPNMKSQTDRKPNGEFFLKKTKPSSCPGRDKIACIDPCKWDMKAGGKNKVGTGGCRWNGGSYNLTLDKPRMILPTPTRSSSPRRRAANDDSPRRPQPAGLASPAAKEGRDRYQQYMRDMKAQGMTYRQALESYRASKGR